MDTSNGPTEAGSVETGKKKRSFWSLFVDFLVSGGLILLVVLIAAVALAINLLIK